MAAPRKQLGQILIDAGKLDEKQLKTALEYKKDHGLYLGQAIVTLGFLTEQELIETLSEQLGMPYLNLMTYEVADDVLDLVDEKTARRLKIMPLFTVGETLTVATSDPLNVTVVDELSRLTGMDVNLVLATESDIEQAQDMFYSAKKYVAEHGEEPGATEQRVVSKAIDEHTEAVEAVDLLFAEAVKVGASDLHIEPREEDVRIRYRVDGVLQQYYTVPRSSMAPLISRVKIMADMDIAESRKPQDGRFTRTVGDKQIDVRASTYPITYGEKIVLRLLDQSKGKIELHKLGFARDTLERWRQIIRLPNGIILVSGPTGSGKTTTLYATLNVINTVELNIMTIEDPIEYRLPNINQGQVQSKAGFTFAEALRAMLRQDPDVIMVGEMRDQETMELAIRAALTGHLVFSTIHTNDAPSAYTRMLDMGMDAYLVSSTVRAVLAQRLIRLLCPRCKAEFEPDEAVLRTLELEEKPEGPLFKPVGCVHCKNSGYFGRAGVYELLIPDEEVADMVNRHANANEIKKVAVKKGMRTLRMDALRYILEGKSSIEEMLRITLA